MKLSLSHFFVVLLVFTFGCEGKKEDGSGSRGDVRAAVAAQDTMENRSDREARKWDFEWFHLADFECLANASERPEMIEALLDLDDNTLASTLSDSKMLVEFARPIVVELMAENESNLPPGANEPWRDEWPENMVFDIRARGEGIDEDESYILGADSVHFLWPFNISQYQLAYTREAWNERIADLIGSGQFTAPESIDRDPDKHSTGNVLKSIDVALEHQRDYRTRLDECSRTHRGDSEDVRRRRHSCNATILEEVEMRQGAVGESLDFRSNSNRHMVNTLLYADASGRLGVEIGTQRTEERDRDRVPEWPCGRLTSP